MYMRVVLLLALISSVHLRYLDNTLLWKQEISKKCTPFTVYQEDCNTCICGADGVGACSKKGCLEISKKCTPFTVYQEDCNTCICGADGVGACSKKGCLDTKPDYSNEN